MKTGIDDLREHLFATIEGLRDGTVDVERARAIADVSGRIIDSAKVEVQFLNVTGRKTASRFLDPPPPVPAAGDGLRRLSAVGQEGGNS